MAARVTLSVCASARAIAAPLPGVLWNACSRPSVASESGRTDRKGHDVEGSPVTPKRDDQTEQRLDGAVAPLSCTATAICIAAFSILVSASVASADAPCRNYPAVAARAIKSRVEAVRLVEREAADRLIGLDTRPWPFLVGQARAAADAIGAARALQEEDGLERCPDAVPRVRRVCATAGLALASALEEQAAGSASQISKQIYAQAMAICEGLMGLTSLRTPLRTSE
jgi:hypothetical protein